MLTLKVYVCIINKISFLGTLKHLLFLYYIFIYIFVGYIHINVLLYIQLLIYMCVHAYVRQRSNSGIILEES